ncbi:MAG: hypothetical protein ACOX19_00945 [Fermentimonas sp.]|jgi:hypothetical protein
MKKVILLLTVIGTTLLMTSCLAGGETSYAGVPLSYITLTETGIVYARTLDGLPITSPEIRMEIPGSFVYINYSWRASENTITEEGVYNVTVADISDPIDQSILSPVAAPSEKVEFEQIIPLTMFNHLPGYGGAYFDYHWICSFGYKKGDGGKKTLAFYHDVNEGTENELIIDIRLVDAPGTVDKDQEEVLHAVNLRPIHDYYAASLISTGDHKNLHVFFRYYREIGDQVELYKTQQFSLMQIVKE